METAEAKATTWQVLYEDGQQHHKQGILTFPAFGGSGGKQAGSLEMVIRPPAMRERIFHWRLPIPDAALAPDTTEERG